jgi:hypothetical protein
MSSLWNLWYDLGRRAKQIEVVWCNRKIAEMPPVDPFKARVIETELMKFREILLHFDEGDIFIAFGRLDRLEELIKQV